MKFGIEIEFVSAVDGDAVARALREAGISCAGYLGYTHRDMDSWKVVHDGSVRATNGNGYGMELVSPPMENGPEADEQIRKVSEVLRGRVVRGRINSSCGFHVHVNARDLSLKAFQRVCYLYGKNEGIIDTIVAPSRRGSSNVYCRSVADFGTTARIGSTRSIGDITRLVASDRFRKLNVVAFSRHGTIEFRQHAGTVEADKIINWKDLVIKLVEAGRENAEGAPAPVASTEDRDDAYRFRFSRSRVLRALVRKAQEQDGVTPVQAQMYLGTLNPVDIAWYFRTYGVPFWKEGRGTSARFHFGQRPTGQVEAPAAPNFSDLDATDLQDLLVNKIKMTAEQFAFWRARQVQLAS